MSAASPCTTQNTEDSQPMWKVISASVTGVSHLRRGQGCQDSHTYRCIFANASRGALVAAVADGAGSASLSADGSRIAAQAATRRASALLRMHVHPLYEAVLKEILQESVCFARRELEAEAVQRKRPIKDFATTLIIAICAPDAIATAQIGDGAVVAREIPQNTAVETEGYTLFSPPQRGEFANQTNFLTSGNWQCALDIVVRRCGVNRLSMFTDGVQSLALSAACGNTPHAPFFTPLFAWAEKQDDEQAATDTLKAFLSSPKVTARADDDLTLLLATLPE